MAAAGAAHWAGWGDGLFSAAARPRAVAPPPAPTGEPKLEGVVLDVRDFGARGDGETDDSAAVRRGLDAAGARRATLFFPAGTYAYRVGEALAPRDGVTLAGEPGRSVLHLRSSGAADFTTFCRPAGDGVTVDGLTLERVEDFPCVLVGVPGVTGFTLSRTSFVGHSDEFATASCHGVQLGIDDSSTARTIRWTDSVVTTMTYGLFQSNASTATTEDVEVARCRFAGNANTDLEFNSPKGATRRVTVADSEFRDQAGVGFAVGLATCTDVTITRNTMRGYPREAVHVEDYSENVTVSDNQIGAAGLRQYAHVQMIGGARGITISGNTFDATMNDDSIVVVQALAGGTEPTPGGRPVAPPSQVQVLDNDFALAPGVRAVSFEGVTGGAVRGNRLTGPGVASTPGAAIDLSQGTSGVDVGDNQADGRPF